MKKIMTISFVLFVSITYVYGQGEARLMRFPAIHGNQVVFSYAGDLYSVDAEGGEAQKLTNHIGYEMFARFSPDGKTLAFTGEYDGNREVYLMPSTGGTPKRLTYTATLGRDDISDRMGPNNIVMSWKDNDHIVFRSRKISFNSFIGQLFMVSKNGGLEEQLPVPRGGWCTFNADGTQMAYNQVFREFRTWKYYKGGMADDVWIYDYKTHSTTNITNNPAQDIFPMWSGNKVFFLSDRDRIMNLFVYDFDTKKTKKLTEFDKYDIKYPSVGDKAIVFENSGYLYTYNLSSGEMKKLHVTISNDNIYSRNEIVDASKFIRNMDLSPAAERVVFSARGEIFSVPGENGVTRNLTKTSGINEHGGVWSPDGKNIAYISDKSGENEIYIVAQDGSTDPVQLTQNATTYKYSLNWSPDSKKIMWADKELKLNYVDVATKKITQVDKAEIWEFNNYNWSPDSKWIVYSRPEQETEAIIYIYNVESAKKYALTEGWFNSGGASFSHDGKYVTFTSARDFHPTYSWTEWNHAYTDMNRVYLIALSKDIKSPFLPGNDEVKIAGNEETNNSGTKKPTEATSKEVKVTVDPEGIQSRIIALPTDAARYWNVVMVGNNVYYARRKTNNKSEMCLFDLKKKKETVLGEYSGFQVSNNGKKMLIRMHGKYALMDLPKAKIQPPKKYVDLSGLKINVDKKAEWQEIFDDAWRQMRDFFYDPGMHGLDWQAIHDKYNVLVPFVNHRDDLNYIIGEMIGELSIGHSYIAGGDKPKAGRIKQGLLGAELSKDKSGFYKIDKILKGQNWDKSLYSPLTDVGIDVNEGDYIIAVDGELTSGMSNIYESLFGKAAKEVMLTVNSKASEAGARTVVVKAIADESKLYYYNWVQNNIRIVSEATDGKVGYIHIPDMGVAGLNEFVKYFYPQLGKKALIIDDRGNGGGNVSPMIIERLRREMSRANVARNTAKSATPRQMLHGPMVCLINEYSASDGDLFPFQFKKHKLGKLIGKRTWGGVTGIRGPIPFVDGGTLYKPEFGTYDETGWIIEGHGVDPDIEVANDPWKEFNGEDEQLNKAIEVILQELKEHPQEIPDIPPFPDKSK